MAATVRVRRRVSSSNLDVPELEQFIGKEVEIVVTEVAEAPKVPEEPWPDNGPSERYPLRGSVLRYDDPFGPAVPEEDWEALQ
jgi:hypothetical protein